MVPVNVPLKVPPVIEVSTIVTWAIVEPEACAKRPVPPVIVVDAVSWNTCELEVGQKTSFADSKTLSPLAAVVVSNSVAVNPPHSDWPVVVLVATKVTFPRCVSCPLPDMDAVIGDVRMKVPEKRPL